MCCSLTRNRAKGFQVFGLGALPVDGTTCWSESGHGVHSLFHVGSRRSKGVLATAGPLRPHAFGGMFARRAPGALLFYLLSRLQPQIYPLMEKPPSRPLCTAHLPLHSRGSPNKGGQNQKWLPHPCLLGCPTEGGSATSPLHSRGSPTKGTKSEGKTYARGHNDAPSISKDGSQVRPDAQIVALR